MTLGVVIGNTWDKGFLLCVNISWFKVFGLFILSLGYFRINIFYGNLQFFVLLEIDGTYEFIPFK